MAQLERLNQILDKRQRQETMYENLLSSSDKLSLRSKQPWAGTVHWMMTIQLRKEYIRDKMLEYLKQKGIDCRQMIYPVHFAQHFKSSYDQHSFPVSKRISLNSLHLPSSTNLQEESIEIISQTVLKGLELYG